MNIKPTLYWNTKIVAGFLIEAASIHRRLPDVRAPGYFSLWPVTLQNDADWLLDMIHGKMTLGPPMPPEVTFSEEVMTWLRLLDRQQQQLVFMRANLVPWKILVEEFGKSKPTLWRERERCLEQMVIHLNRIDLRGEHYRQLRNRACGIGATS